MLVVFGAFGIRGGPSIVEAAPLGVWLVDDYGNDEAPGTSLTSCEDTDGDFELASGDTIVAHTGDDLIFCGEFEDGTGDVSWDSDDYGEWTDAVCDGDGEDSPCVDEVGEGTDLVQIPDDTNVVTQVLITFECDSSFGRTLITVDQDDDEFTFWVECRANATKLEVTASPTTVEIAPARSNTSHSLIVGVATDSGGNPAFGGYVIYDADREIVWDVDDEGDPIVPLDESPEVDFTTNLCSIEEGGVDTEDELEDAESDVRALNTAAPGTYLVWEFSDAALASVDSTIGSDTGNLFYLDGPDSGLVTDRTATAAVLGCNPSDFKSWAPGTAHICATLDVPGTDLVTCVDVTVIGPPAAIVVEASPTDLTCGEKSAITVTVKDALGQNVSDHTRVEIITNLGGVLGGTGAAAGFALPVTPISSTAADTFGGVASAYLLTSNAHAGPYEVLATAGGTAVSDGGFFFEFFGVSSLSEISDQAVATYLGGVFSTPPVTAQVTVNCSLPAPAPAATITAPDTGTGITPPNTGDAGLLSEQSSSSWLLLALAGSAVAMALTGLTFKVVRR
jgi:hypothetical protein